MNVIHKVLYDVTFTLGRRWYLNSHNTWKQRRLEQTGILKVKFVTEIALKF